MKKTVISVGIRALGTNPKGLLKELEVLELKGRAKSIKTTAL